MDRYTHITYYNIIQAKIYDNIMLHHNRVTPCNSNDTTTTTNNNNKSLIVVTII